MRLPANRQRLVLGDLLSAAGAAVGVGIGLLALGGWGGVLVLSVAACALLAGLVFAGRGRGVEFSGIIFVGLGLSVAFYFWDIIMLGGEDFSVASLAVGVALGGGMVARGNQHALSAALVTLLLFYGAAGIVTRGLVAADSICWIYEPHAKGKGRLVAAEPCYIVETSGGELHLAPGGHLGVLPMHPSTSHVGKKAGPFRIVGVLEIGGVVEGVGDGRFAQVDFSMVSPGGGRGFGVVRNPLIPSI